MKDSFYPMLGVATSWKNRTDAILFKSPGLVHRRTTLLIRLHRRASRSCSGLSKFKSDQPLSVLFTATRQSGNMQANVHEGLSEKAHPRYVVHPGNNPNHLAQQMPCARAAPVAFMLILTKG